MKILNILFVGTVTTALVSGCYSRRTVIKERGRPSAPRTVIYEHGGAAAPVREVREVVVVDAPPAPQVELPGLAPGRDHVWVPGHWTRSSDRWVWMSGRWELRPHPTSVYMPGHWERRGNGYIWREGYWQ
jgi:hypothetical protein